jgi:hypothetical protein
MIYLCRKLHFTKVEGRKNDHSIFCNECRKNIPKFETYKFQTNNKNGLYFLARESEQPAIGRRMRDSKKDKRLKNKWKQRRYRATERGRIVTREANRAYRARKKAEKLATVGTTNGQL